MLTLADVFEAITGQRISGADLVVTEASVDSRQTIPGSMFVALPGERVDGHDYLQAAFSKGAHMALVQKKDLPGDIPVIDLSQPVDLSSCKIPPAPFCIYVPDTLQALTADCKILA